MFQPSRLILAVGKGRMVALGLVLIASSVGARPQADVGRSSRTTVMLTSQDRHASSVRQTVVGPLDGDFISENVYTNGFFGFTYEFPKSWNVDGVAIDNANEQRKEVLSRPTQTTNASTTRWFRSKTTRCWRCPNIRRQLLGSRDRGLS
jgi:hypothetical protein